MYGPDGRDQYGWTRELNAASTPMRAAGIAVIRTMFMAKATRFPPTLGSTIGTINDGATPAQIAAFYLTPDDLEATTIPATVDAAWIDTHTSMTYLAAGASYGALGKGGRTIMLHTSLDKPFKHPPVGDSILATFIDGHCEILPLDRARKLIAESNVAIAAAK